MENAASEQNSASPQQSGAPVSSSGDRRPDLADHFLMCSRLGRYLTVADGSRFVITDDFREFPVQPEAAAMASLYSKDLLVAQAALLPLGGSVHKMSSNKREKYERLFHLIEEQALSDVVRHSAQEIIKAGFRNAEIRALEAELGDKLSPARMRYRAFLEVVKQLMDRNITAGPFLDEFRDFTKSVAGKLDFGIYSFCLDRLFGSPRITMKVKKLLVLEILQFPPIIRRELLTNILSLRGQIRELTEFVKYMVATELGKNAAIEIELLEAFKLQRLSMEDIEISLKARAG
ncbi:MAG: hypothetical protein ISR51_04635 [Rhodospirillales bacterium]|nr:hypothetical protein [Alphaproteobacteria bacterium]MBL6947942.1 hypothetical protein [Rhodospirillales bacterium]